MLSCSPRPLGLGTCQASHSRCLSDPVQGIPGHIELISNDIMRGLPSRNDLQSVGICVRLINVYIICFWCFFGVLEEVNE